ncbi:uncharacterized protein si:ch211-91p5.3 isoform X1 [Esox lucius]|uniref:DRBM domain-containing protein n=2 Tax=Esox lucius TaxID=8010 RepID=A0A3P8XKN8_ESOLU|nr:uncharacterized protein si:ch211-91p5.3 isoform X1 [Esox lucius]
MESFKRFQDDGYKNWIKTTMGLNCLKTRLGDFLENETQTYHNELRNQVKTTKGRECIKNCGLRQKGNSKFKVLVLCKEVCEPWRDAILSYHKGGPVYWNNSKPYLWPTEKWEVAKAHMNNGNGKNTKVEDFDISAFLNLMAHCAYFKKFVKPGVLTEVTNVRNKVMHSADFQVERKDLDDYMARIKNLGLALEKQAPLFSKLAEEIEQLQNINLSFNMNEGGQDSTRSPEDVRNMERFLSLEQQILKEKLECLSQRYEEDRGTALTVEELQCVRVFLEGNKDLQESLQPQWEKLKEVQESVKILTNRVDTLERITHPHDPEFKTDILKYKNHLYEEARRRGWPEPVFTEKMEASGYRGCVKVRGLTFEGTQVHPSRKTAHQEVAKLALSQLPKDSANRSELANDTEEGEASSSQTDQPQSVSCTGPTFFGSVTVVLKTDITSGEGHSGETEAVESAYKKLALLLDLPKSDSFSKAAVLKHCDTRDVQPPEETVTFDSEGGGYLCTLQFTGPVTFYVSEGSSKKKQAQKQAAKVALQRLSGVLGDKEVVGENYVSALKELLEAQTPRLDMPVYDITDRKGGGMGEVTGKGLWSEVSLNPPESEVVPVSPMDTLVTTDLMDTTVSMNAVAVEGAVVPKNITVAMETQEEGASESDHRRAAPTILEERVVSSDGGGFFSSVAVRVQKDLVPQEASTPEGALQAAYCSLLQALALDPPHKAGGEKQSVLEFFRWVQSVPPIEDCVTTMDGKHRCTLGIVGNLTFHSQEPASKKQQAEQWAAREALKHLDGVLSGVVGQDTSGASQNYKGRLQELLVKHGGGSKPEYKTENKKISRGAAAGPVTGETPGSTQQADELSVSVAVDKETTAEDPGPPPPKRSAGGGAEAIRSCLGLLGLQPPCVVCEEVCLEQLFDWKVEVQLEHYIFRNQTCYSTKKDAIRGSYHSLGTAGEICQPGTDPSQSTGKVKQFFLQQKFQLPEEDVQEPEKGQFYCSLKDITCVFTYSGQGSSEVAARKSAYERALSQLVPLIGYNVPVASSSSAEEAEQRLKNVLNGAGHPSANSALKGTQYRSSAKLSFFGYSMECQHLGSKKANRAQLSQRLLGLLGEDQKGTSVRNVLDEWFLKRDLEKPVFEDNPSGSKVTFSTPLLCSYTDWQDSQEKAEKRLVDELRMLVKFLFD